MISVQEICFSPCTHTSYKTILPVLPLQQDLTSKERTITYEPILMNSSFSPEFCTLGIPLCSDKPPAYSLPCSLSFFSKHATPIITNQLLQCPSNKTAPKYWCLVGLHQKQGAAAKHTVITVKTMGKKSCLESCFHLGDHLSCAMQIITGDRSYSQCLATAVTGVKNRSAFYQHY